MEQSVFYCFRNRLKEIADQIRKTAEEKEIPLSISPTYCMKLCMFCEGQHVAIVDKQVVIEKDKDQAIKKIIEKF
ncbi:hypothetical protein PP175_20740 [Aneurinibacillus sp. Ricciae_BoGa-3]|uniref:hypothetical protein n=1 Tax=Aneurinibacillus sp. Ricciae_BoGa-3 TaxID=3022697 RepID=UPI002340B571|nr:hypothetical protein [Aneurinibacillus sp. Ricciae_BoGa-3]WCK53731.1 hypothetical protein PP175_20740 [Aneurinibacillus sp. Ricciae_BoGa-3]